MHGDWHWHWLLLLLLLLLHAVNPMCLHSGSTNRTTNPRYAYFQSYCTHSAEYLKEGLKGYHADGMDALATALPEELRFLLD
eukprot:COSAG06_NODE_15012_length_1105_cov_1.638171_2_plen_81_part_01